MAAIVEKTFWCVKPPDSWPQAPEYMSFSALSELEVCPSRWALTSANYLELWDRKGYPTVPRSPALEGTVVHLALETITRRLSARGCPSISDASAVTILKELGGFSTVIKNSIDRSLIKYDENPRAIPILNTIRQRLNSRKGEIRTRVQHLLSRLNLEQEVGPVQTEMATLSPIDLPSELVSGSHPEVILKVSDLRWYGIADLITLSRSRCEIRDFKTGTPKDKHRFQIYTYALLWWRDHNLNPSGRLADRLVLSYDSGDVNVPALKREDLKDVEAELRRRTSIALAAIEANPPEARPNTENCVYCGVRHLCDPYWDYLPSIENKNTTAYFGDLQLEIVGRHGTTSWDGLINSCRGIKTGSQILLRTRELPFIPSPKQHLRVLNLHVSLPYTDPSEGTFVQAVATGVCQDSCRLN